MAEQIVVPAALTTAVPDGTPPGDVTVTVTVTACSAPAGTDGDDNASVVAVTAGGLGTAATDTGGDTDADTTVDGIVGPHTLVLGESAPSPEYAAYHQ